MSNNIVGVKQHSGIVEGSGRRNLSTKYFYTTMSNTIGLEDIAMAMENF
jgi:hypothetical protein